MSLKRYYDDLGQRNREVDLPHGAYLPMRDAMRALHGLYTHWVRGNCHRSDFVHAVEHTAEMLFDEWAAAKRPLLQVASPLPEVKLAAARKQAAPANATRFHDELCDVNPDIDLSSHRPVLQAHFAAFAAAGFAPRDFVLLVRDAARAVIYDHQLAMCFTDTGADSEAYLTRPHGT